MHAPYQLAAAAAHTTQRWMLPRWRRLLTGAARDDTAGSADRTCLVVAPHPDDETLGCGATIARKRAAGTPVTVVIAADGRWAQRGSVVVSPPELATIRASEALDACRALGVGADDVRQLGHEDNHVAAVEELLAAQLAELLREVRPAEVLVVTRLDHHPDHRAVNRSLHAAARGLAGGRPLVAEYPVWSWIDGPWRDQQRRPPLRRGARLLAEPVLALAGGRPVSVATAGFLAAKRAALGCYASQATNLTGEATWAVMPPELLELFLGSAELFLRPARSAR